MRTNIGVAVAVGLFVFACGGGTATVPETDASTGGDAGDGGVEAAAPSDLVECENTGPFASEACGVALQRRCRAFASERDCAAAESVELVGYEFGCGWAKVVRFSDVASCTVESTVGRCEAYLLVSRNCVSPCGPEGGGLYDSLVASVEQSELVQNPCGTDGPAGPGFALVNQQGPTREWHACGVDSPPPPAELCACTSVACEQ